jgi:hypothetical protein
MLTLILAFASAVHAQGTTPTDWRFAQPDAEVRLSINLKTFLNSPVVAAMKQQAPKESQAQIGMVLAMLSTIDRVSISARQTPPQAGKPSSAADADALILINGAFDASFLKGMFGAGSAQQAKQVDAHTVLIGQGASLDAAMARLSGKAPAMPADELEQSDLWVGGDVARLSQQQGQPSVPGLENLRTFSLGMNTGENVDFSLILTTTDAPAAQGMSKMIHDLLAQAGQAPETAAMLAKALDIRQDGAKLRLHFVPPPEMIKAAQEQASSADLGSSLSSLQPLLGMLGIGGGPAAASSAPAPRATPLVPPQDHGGKIMIYGLDGGPKEVKPEK